MTTENPYAPPATPDTEPEEIRLRRRRGPLQMGAIGFVAGGFVGATAGAIAAGVLGFLVFLALVAAEPAGGGEDGLLRPDAAIAVMGAFLGAFFGGGAGIVIGTIGGVGVVLTRSPRAKAATVAMSVTCGLFGGAFGLLGGLVVMNTGVDEIELVWPVAGTLLGLACGTVGGLVLGRGLGRLAWRPPE